jgi:hypothetical protein
MLGFVYLILTGHTLGVQAIQIEVQIDGNETDRFITFFVRPRSPFKCSART